MNKISVVVPFYKVKREYMDQCIKSIINQTYTNLEIILVDDGSPDQCGEICDLYQQKDERIFVIHKPNGGLSDARNAGIDKATGEWITFVDGDDWIEKDFFDHFINRINQEKQCADIYYYSGFRNYPSKVIEGVPYFNDGTIFASYRDREYLQSKCCTNHLLKDGNRKGITISSAWAKIYNTKFIKENKLKFPIIPYDEDSIFYMYAIEAASKIEYVSKSVYHYRYTENSIVNQYRPNAKDEQIIYLNHLFGFAQKKKGKEFNQYLYLRSMTSMLLLIKLYFFNAENKDNFFKRQKECKEFFEQEPFRSTLKNIHFDDLGRNAKIKYILLKIRCYGLLELLRKENSKKLIGNKS